MQGIFPALMTPFDENGDVDEAGLRQLTEAQIAAGVQGHYICGGTGEGMLLDNAERMRVAAAVVDQGKGRVKAIVHVGQPSTRLAAELAAHAESIGADAVAAVPPLYYATDVTGMIRHYQTIRGATKLPMLIYNIPGAVGYRVTAEHVRRVREAVPGIVGMKFSDFNLFELRNIIEDAGAGFLMFSGMDEVIAAARLMGASGHIGSTLNLMPRLYLSIYEAIGAGRAGAAMELQFRANRIIRVLLQGDAMQGQKHILNRCGFSCGQGRPPLRPLSDSQRAALDAVVKEHGDVLLKPTG